MRRHNGRIVAIQVLYAIDFNNENIDNFDERFADIQEQLENEEYQVEIDFILAKKLIKGVLKNKNEIDNLINQIIEGWDIQTLSIVDRAIIRTATYEMKFTKTPKPVIINEAVEITKAYSNLDNNEQARFNNRLLDRIAKVIYGE